ncbi:hypothetical protein [Halobacteriovorax sp. HLS]|uniref:hypothetical protein n=1 Tax=Halobacteriovorax sp. HLS TaxID=2234000 RepID=UPI000FD95EDC|nr:hypothetical protein [Halobacteriovorax sp. HLS]
MSNKNLERYKLSFSKAKITEFQFNVMEDLWWKRKRWNDKTVKIYDEHKSEYSFSSDLRQDVWASTEEGVNFSFHNLCMAIPPKDNAQIFNKLLGEELFSTLSLTNLLFPSDSSLKRILGNPDFSMYDEINNVFIIGEQKVSLGSSAHKFSFEQFLKYQNLSIFLKSIDPCMKLRIILFHPSENIENDIYTYDKWDWSTRKTEFAHVSISDDSFVNKGKKDVVGNYSTIENIISPLLDNDMFMNEKINNFSKDVLQKRKFPYSKMNTVTWKDYVEISLNYIKEKEHLTHLQDEIKNLLPLFIK